MIPTPRNSERKHRWARIVVALCFATVVTALLSAAAMASSSGGHAEAESHQGISHLNPWVSFGYGVLAAFILLVISLLAGRRLTLVPGKLQNLVELAVGGLEDFFVSVLGHGADKHVPILITFFLYILTMNLFGLTGVLIPPTSTLNMTIALAVVAILYVQWQGIKANGFGGYIRHFVGDPWWLAPLMFPLHVIGELAKPLSLSFRLFGNIFGEETVMVQLALLGPLVLFGSHVLPVQFLLLPLGLLKCIIQAVVFTTLMAVYLVIMTEHEETEHTEPVSGPGAASEAVAAH